jgi:hypothetical protein
MEIILTMNYLEATEKLRKECKERSENELESLGEKLPKCIDGLNELLPLLEGVACCYWSCPGKEEPHVIERIIGKAVSHTLAGMELAFTGHYDEAMGLARSVGESTNLVWLFSLNPKTFLDWQALDERKRWNKYRPAEVRRRIIGLNSPVPIDEERYSVLSTETAHIHPESMPQSYNSLVPTLGGFYQEAGFIAAVNEIAAPISILAGTAIKLLPNLPNNKRENIHKSSLNLLKSVGSVGLKKVTKLREENRE